MSSTLGGDNAYIETKLELQIIQQRRNKNNLCSESEDYDDILTKEMLAIMKNEAGCSVPYINRTGSGLDICNDEESYAKAADRYYEFMVIRGLRSRPNVPHPCNYMHIIPWELRKVKANGTSLLWFEFPTEVRVEKEMKAYTDLSYMAEVGGYVGLFLGYSFLQVFGYVGKALDSFVDKIFR